MAILDSPILTPLTSTRGSESLVVVRDRDQVNLPVNGILGLLPGDVSPALVNGNTISARMSVVTGAITTINLPTAAGPLRQVTVINTGSGDCTLDGFGSENILSGLANALTLVIPTAKSAQLLSDGTRWYHVTNDA